MADTKISALTSWTPPLAGTEPLPVVQSSTTVQTTPLAVIAPAYSTTAYAATITPVANTQVRIIATGNIALALPTGGVDGARVKLWITASGSNVVVTLNASYVIPTDSTLTATLPTIVNGKKARLIVEYDATRSKWEVIGFINGY